MPDVERAMAVRRPPRVDTRLPARGERSRGRCTLIALLVALGLAGGCGPDGEPSGEALPGEWPLTFEVPAILGYAAGLGGGRLESALDSLGWQARGIDPSRPDVVLLLDPTVLGAPVALVLPVTDGDALVSSLDASEFVEPLGGGRHRVTLPPNHPLRNAVRVLKGGASIRSIGDVMALLDDAGPLTITINVELRDDWALLVPSFEAALVARQVLPLLPLHDVGPGRFAAALDLERIVDTYHEEFTALEQQVSGILTGAQTAGLAGVLAAGMSRSGAENPLPVSGEFLWTLWSMFQTEDLVALGAMVEGLPAPGIADLPEPDSDAFALSLRLQRRATAGEPGVMGSYRPALSPTEGLAVEADPAAFRLETTRWFAPLADFVKGEGPPARRWLDNLDELLAPWSGRLALEAVGDGAVLVVSQEPGRSFDGEGWSTWLDTLFDAARADPSIRPAVLLGEGQLTRVPHDDALVYFGGDVDADDLEATIARVLGGEAPVDGPFLRLAGPGIDLSLTADGSELLLEATVERGIVELDR
jgi:hypothetical protein